LFDFQRLFAFCSPRLHAIYLDDQSHLFHARLLKGRGSSSNSARGFQWLGGDNQMAACFSMSAAIAMRVLN
jgi:hypothetical protein